IKNLAMMAIVASALLVGTVAPAVVKTTRRFLNFKLPFMSTFYDTLTFYLVPTVVLFYGFSMFYVFAPRGRKSFSQVWIGAVMTTILLQLAQWLLIWYAA